ncbi:succinate dehydrogenase / fumarate reductase, membrane anchor subunit [Patescibacteria group bacterium]|nr:succinate dehydrogenase / fumarate reductase, membrane anchor subunit [Patescibacteria group bacterium]
MQYRTPLSRVRGLGSAQSGTHHWWMQRVTAVALVPLSFFAINFLDLMLHASYQQTVVWLATPLHSTVMIAWLLCVFYHSALGMQIVIEDYVSHDGVKIIGIWTVNLIFLLLTLASVLAVLRIIFSVGQA